MDTKRICLWSGPRNVSTALMYAFAQRSDTQVIDEPLYAHYLQTKYGTEARDSTHPGAKEVMASMSTDSEQVIREVILGPCEKPVLFMKQMAHHLIDIDLRFLARTLNVFLIRDPREMLPVPHKGYRDTDARRYGVQDAARSFDSVTRCGTIAAGAGCAALVERSGECALLSYVSGWGCGLRIRCCRGRQAVTRRMGYGHRIGIRMCIGVRASRRIVRSRSRFQRNWRRCLRKCSRYYEVLRQEAICPLPV